MRPRPKADGWGVPALAALASAGLLAAAMPGRVGWWPLLFVGLAPLLLLVLHAHPGRSLLVGFLFGLVYHLALLYWIVIVLNRYGGLPLGLAVPALVLLAAYMACFPAICCFAVGLVVSAQPDRSRSAAALVWAAPAAWVGCEYLRSVLFTGFPWMDLGYGLFAQPILIQAADLGGHHLLSFALVLSNGLATAGLDRLRHRSSLSRQTRWPLLAAAAVLLAIGGYSFARQQTVDAALASARQARVAVVQGNIDQSVKWSQSNKVATVNTYLRLSRQMTREGAVDLVVWPETALPFYPQQDPLVSRLDDFATAEATWLLTGAPLFTITPGENGAGQEQYWNGALLLGPGGRIGGEYAKQHLVPFGEYVPLRRWLPFLQPLVVNIGDFSAGAGQKPLALGAMRLGVLICYESIFPDIARESVGQGANLLVNITNDAWYGRSSAPWQSMAMAVLRAVENRRALVRAANTGISGFVDPLGRITARTELFVETAQAASTPLLELNTVFGQGGHWFGLACAGCALLAAIVSRRRP